MAYTGTPVVVATTLLLGPHERVVVGSDRWWAWLETATCFSYQPRWTTYRLTARREQRRHRFYWYGYLRAGGKLHNVYLGKAEALDLDTLDAALRQLLHKRRRRHSTPAG